MDWMTHDQFTEWLLSLLSKHGTVGNSVKL